MFYNCCQYCKVLLVVNFIVMEVVWMSPSQQMCLSFETQYLCTHTVSKVLYLKWRSLVVFNKGVGPCGGYVCASLPAADQSSPMIYPVTFFKDGQHKITNTLSKFTFVQINILYEVFQHDGIPCASVVFCHHV